jgi:hypothetical protein
MWIFTGGAILVLLQSILSGAKRNWWSLLIGCVLGGGGAWLAGHIWADSKYVYIYCGVAAVLAENLLLGVAKAGQEFAQHPIKVGIQLARTFFPTIGKETGETTQPMNTDELE